MAKPRPICVECRIEYRLEVSGVLAVTMFQKPPEPYEIYSTDLWRCPVCGHEMLKGFGERPIVQHWEQDFDEILNSDTRKVFCYEHVRDSLALGERNA